MKTTEYLGYEIRRDGNKRWRVMSGIFEDAFSTLKEAKEAVREVEKVVEEHAREIERNPEGSAIMRADVETSYPVRDLGGFGRLDEPATLRKVERMVKREVAEVAKGVQVKVEEFIETDSGNIGHANAIYAVGLVGDAATVSKVVRKVFGCDPKDAAIREAGR